MLKVIDDRKMGIGVSPKMNLQDRSPIISPRLRVHTPLLISS